MYSHSLLLGISIFCCEIHFLKTFSCICQIYVAEVLIIHFCNNYHLRFYHHMSTKVRSIFWGINSRSRSSSRSIFVLYLFDLNLVSTPSLAKVHLCLTLAYVCRGSTLDLDLAPDPNKCCTF